MSDVKYLKIKIIFYHLNLFTSRLFFQVDRSYGRFVLVHKEYFLKTMAWYLTRFNIYMLTMFERRTLIKKTICLFPACPRPYSLTQPMFSFSREDMIPGELDRKSITNE